MENSIPSGPLSPEEVQRALEIARRLIKAGVPVFAAAPRSDAPGQFYIPKHWEQSTPDERVLEQWRPGWALAAVGGSVCDFLDMDPRSGGAVSAREILAADQWPRSFGRQTTPSGGTHDLISATGERKVTSFMPGLDLQAGDRHGHGRGFVWISPTVRPSKDPDTLGQMVPYRWVSEPDLDHLMEWRSPSGDVLDDSLEGIRSRIHTRRSSTPSVSHRPAVDPDDPFMTTSQAAQAHRDFTLTQAQGFVRPHLIQLQGAQIGEIEERTNVAAATLSHFVPSFWTVDQAYQLLLDALGHTAYDPTRPGSTWTAEKFLKVLDGSRPPLDPWIAVRREEPPRPPAAAVETGKGEETLTTLEKLKRKLISGDDLAEMPPAEPLVLGLLDLDTESWLIGAPGSLKSFVAMDLAGHVGTGRDWQGMKVRQGPVLYLAAEGARGMVLRTRAWKKVHGSMEGVTFLPYPVKVQSHDGQWSALVEIAQEIQPVLIVIDTQARVTVGLNENDAKEMGIFLEAVSWLKRVTGACVLVVHHTGRNGGNARGSSAIDGAQDTELKVVRAEPRSSLICKLIQDKQKDMAEGDRGGLELALKVIDLGIDPQTRRELSSLVLMGLSEAAYHLAQGHGVTDEELEQFKGREPEAWTVELYPVQAKWPRRTLQVLADHAHDRGLTRTDARDAIAARWGQNPEKDKAHWINTWNKVVSLPIVINIAGERFALDQAELARLRVE